MLRNLETLRNHGLDHGWSDSVLIVNTGYDKQLIPHYEGVFKEGEEAITDRKKLYYFLKKAKEYDYKYIVLDIQVDGINSDYNDSIKSLVLQMRDICIPRSEQFDHESILDPVAVWVDYNITPTETGFTKYKLLHNGHSSMALHLYSKRGGADIKRVCGLFYFDRGRLCQKTLIPVRDYITTYIENTQGNELKLQDGVYSESLPYKNLGSDFCGDDDIGRSVKDKIVVIGNLVGTEDMHDTFAGRMPGMLININAYIGLVHGLHLVNFIVVILLFLLYTGISMYYLYGVRIFFRKKVKYRIAEFFEIPIVKLCLSFLGFSLVFVLLSVILYCTVDYYYSTLLPSIWFTVFSHVVKYCREKKQVLRSENNHHE